MLYVTLTLSLILTLTLTQGATLLSMLYVLTLENRTTILMAMGGQPLINDNDLFLLIGLCVALGFPFIFIGCFIAHQMEVKSPLKKTPRNLSLSSPKGSETYAHERFRPAAPASPTAKRGYRGTGHQLRFD